MDGVSSNPGGRRLDSSALRPHHIRATAPTKNIALRTRTHGANKIPPHQGGG